MRAVTSKAKPFVKWAGGKGQLLPELIPKAPAPGSYARYVEPFLGGGAVFFALEPQKAVLSDVNAALIGLYRAVQTAPSELVSLLGELSSEYLALDAEKQEAMFYRVRSEYNATLPDSSAPVTNESLLKSARMVFLNKTGFNGMYRENSKGGFNIPFGKNRRPMICDAPNVLAASRALAKADLSRASFSEALEGAGTGDFAYLDPPYFPVSLTSNFTAYARQGFAEREQRELKETFEALTKRGCLVMQSNSHTPLIEKLYAGYRTETVMASRSINSRGGGRGKVKELVIMNYDVNGSILT